MIYNIEQNWIFDIIDQYHLSGESKYYSPSDWVNDNQINIPENLIKEILFASISRAHEYIYSYNLEMEKNLILDTYGVCGSDKKIISSTICGNSTASIFLLLMAMRNLGLSKGIAVTPCYYSFIKLFYDLQMDVKLIGLSNKDGYGCIEEMIFHQAVKGTDQFLVITDPIYGTGQRILHDSLVNIVDFCNRYNMLLIYDGTLGGLNWGDDASELIDTKAINAIKNCNRYIILDSPTKKLFLNGMKIGIALGSKDICEEMDEVADTTTGSMSASQKELISLIYGKKHHIDIIESISKNILSINKSYDLVSAAMSGSRFSWVIPESGFFMMPFDRERPYCKTNFSLITLSALMRLRILIYPSIYFAHSTDNFYGFRINLSKDPLQLASSVRRFINFYDQITKDLD